MCLSVFASINTEIKSKEDKSLGSCLFTSWDYTAYSDIQLHDTKFDLIFDETNECDIGLKT